MKQQPSSSRAIGEGYKYVALGATFAGGIVGFMLLGLLLDRWLGWTPILTVTGTMVGLALSFLNVYARLKAEENSERGR